jgi:hypothetical protein
MEIPMTDDQQLYVICAMAFILVLLLNIWYWSEREATTPEERKAEDAELRGDPLSWCHELKVERPAVFLPEKPGIFHKTHPAYHRGSAS